MNVTNLEFLNLKGYTINFKAITDIRVLDNQKFKTKALILKMIDESKVDSEKLIQMIEVDDIGKLLEKITKDDFYLSVLQKMDYNIDVTSEMVEYIVRNNFENTYKYLIMYKIDVINSKNVNHILDVQYVNLLRKLIEHNKEPEIIYQLINSVKMIANYKFDDEEINDYLRYVSKKESLSKQIISKLISNNEIGLVFFNNQLKNNKFSKAEIVNFLIESGPPYSEFTNQAMRYPAEMLDLQLCRTLHNNKIISMRSVNGGDEQKIRLLDLK